MKVDASHFWIPGSVCKFSSVFFRQSVCHSHEVMFLVLKLESMGQLAQKSTKISENSPSLDFFHILHKFRTKRRLQTNWHKDD